MIEHHLITISLDGRDLHGYLMADDKRCLMHLTNYMLDLSKPRLPIVMQTLLDKDAVKTVRDIICSLNKGNREKFDGHKNKKYLAIIFDLPLASPENKTLLDLH